MMAPVGLPETVRVKISSETAEYVSLTPVVMRDMAVRELIEMMLGVTGLDADRIARLLRRGSFVSGASRFRWSGLEVSGDEVAALLPGFPASDPGRPFVPSRSSMAVLHGGGARIEMTRETAARKRGLHRQSFWDALMEAAQSAPARYVDYSHKDRGDRYIVALSPGAAARLRESAGLLSYSRLEADVRGVPLDEIEFIVSR